MTSNITVTPGSGATIAADDVGGGLLVQRVKIAVGATGSATDVAAGQTTMASSLPVAIASNQSAIPVTLPVGQTNKAGSTPVTLANDQGALAVTLPTGQSNKAGSTSVTLASDQGALAVTVPVGQQTKAASTPVVIASDQGALAVTVPVGQTTMSASTPVAIASNQSTLPVNQVSSSYDVSNSFTRPADTNAYTANDVVGGALTFTAVGPSASTIMITGTQLEIDIAAVPSGMTSFRLYLYNVTPPTAYVDNAAWDLPSGDRASFLGYVDLGTPVDLGSTLYVEVSNINKQLKLASANIFGYLITNGAYTPAASDAFKITLHTVAV